MKERYHISGMTCSACSSHVEKAANKLEGVEKASVNLLTETMDIIYDDQKLQEQDIVRAVEAAGYGVARMGGGSGAPGTGNTGTGADAQGAVSGGMGSSGPGGQSGRDALSRKAKEESRAMKWRLGISIGFLIPLMYVAMYHMLHGMLGIPAPGFVLKAFHGNENAMIFALTQFLLLLPILYMNRKFFSVGFKTLAHLSPNMDSLIAVGASAAVGYGLFAMYRIAYGMGHGEWAVVEHYAHDLYFESAGTILTLITVGKYLESRSKGRTSEAITKLMDLSPKTAIRLREDGSEEEVPTEALRAGDIFLIKPGSLVPVDGTVLEGTSGVDEAAITGESVPVEKQAGDRVISATLNKAGFLKCRADRVGEDTTLSQIVRLVEEASGSKAPIAQLADKVAGVFVPAVMGIAFFTLIVWLAVGAGAEFAISSAIAVLVISCPCALGLATPVAIMVGTGVGAGNGILIKSGEALQRARDVDTVVLDKTGTITEGNLKVLDQFGYVKGMSLETVLAAAAALERKSEHPLADAVIKAAEQGGCPEYPVRDFKAVFGRGIQGVLEQDVLVGGSEPVRAGRMVYVGNRAYLEEAGVLTRAETVGQMSAEQLETALNDLADEGRTPLLVAEEDRILGIIAVADEVKSGSLAAIRAWKKMGVRVVMLTGDNKRTAQAVCRRMELSEVIAEVLPQDKEREIRKLQESGCRVAMIGDGINDAPALMTADVGMAIGAGTDVAIESADIVLMKNDLRDAVTAMQLSRQVIRNIKQNLFWAFFYNCIGIPLAAGLWYPLFHIRLNPMFGAAAMSMSSIFVVGNALRLKGFKGSFGRGKTENVVGGRDEETQPDRKTEHRLNSKTIQQTEQKGGNEMKKVITVEGMMCGHCTGRVQKALEAVEGVTRVVMSLEEKTATVELSAEVADETLKAAVTEAGYEVTAIA
ncbi:MAG: heavy metal translocating P-type ATPase [Clostridium sp.]|nr:heavy metal translocating P-type ATPase [Acetatifactor muris]MCM1526831.1 heavy metal translocating P-type ATPase [Bacteroides sp.]MCM1562969.1 heavy metal translocating P-type ATPase [Clostridium sp.]